ncbi:tryptophan--tRNA ligase [Patescibacteria group bacterium]|nr:tryptophan--tRNA ligase [Patescibacteria group bacterium]
MEDEQRANLERVSREDHEAKSALWAAKADYYPEKLVELGLKSIDRFVQYHPNPSRLMKMGITFGHRDLESVADAMANNKPWAVVSGLNPSGPLHFGHKQVFDELLWLQQQGADVYIPITNDESYVVDKAKSLGESRKIAYEQVIPSIIAMGFSSEKTHIFVDSDYPDIYNLAMDVSKHLSLNRVFGVFGFGQDEEGENPGTVFYRGAVQIAQILLPQLEEFGGPKPTLIPVGVDQYPYILLARDIARKKGLIPPSAIFTKFTHGLDGQGKMSSSRPASTISLTDEPKSAQRRIRGAYTGGSVLASFQKEHGGVPGVCPIYTLRTYHFEEDNRVWDQCSNGEILCGQCKGAATEDVVKYLTDHQEKLVDARKRIDEFILKTPIKSILK